MSTVHNFEVNVTCVLDKSEQYTSTVKGGYVYVYVKVLGPEEDIKVLLWKKSIIPAHHHVVNDCIHGKKNLKHLSCHILGNQTKINNLHISLQEIFLQKSLRKIYLVMGKVRECWYYV